jgi:predicted nucleic acid-binding protein
MASKPSRREVLVESDFLFGLRKGDKHHGAVSKALSMHREGVLGISVLSSAVVEVRTTLYSRGLRFHEVENALALMDAMLSEAEVRKHVPVTLSDVVLTERLRSQFAELTFFDSLHAATSKRVGIPLLSSDPTYKKIGVTTMSYEEL